jgi:hypothetical protein
MQNGDLATWVDTRIVVILEGILAQIPEPEVHRSGIVRQHKEIEWPTVENWGWSKHAVKIINDKAYRLNVPVDVVTFLSPEVGDMAADWLDKYEVRVSSCEYSDFDMFCESLSWRPNVHHVVDSVPDRLDHYGIRAYETGFGGLF